jgi:HAD superfamily hydrolase (TIGR01509 family)
MPAAQPDFRYDMVVFDAGGTLIGFYHYGPFQEFLAQSGLPASTEEAQVFHRRLISVILAQRDGAQGLGAHEHELNDWWRDIFARTWPERPDLGEGMFDWLLAGRFDRLLPDTRPALEALRRLGMPLGILSNFDTHLYPVLDSLGVLDYFEFVIISVEVGLAKPDPRIFDLVVDKAKRPRHRLLYVGDHIGDDIEGAWAAGLDAVLIDRMGRQAGVHCPRIGSLLDLVQYVQVPTTPYPALVFDMDGVVLDSMPTHLVTWQRTLAPLGIEPTAADLYPLEGMPTEQTAQRLTERLAGQACSETQAQQLAATKRRLFRELFNPTFVPGIVPLLYDLHGRGYRLGLVTGSARSVVDETLAPAGMLELFDTIVSGDEVSHGKPDPEPYRRAADALGLRPPECLAVENAPLGIQSATAAGMRCVALTTTLPAGVLSDAGADYVFSDGHALRNWLLTL